MKLMTEQERRIGRARVLDGKLAKLIGWTGLKIVKKAPTPFHKEVLDFVLVGIPPQPPYTQMEVPHFHEDITAASVLADTFGLEAKHRSKGWFVRPKALFAVNPNLDAHSAEGSINGPRAICEAVVARIRNAEL
jgi:hypothetical protein